MSKKAGEVRITGIKYEAGKAVYLKWEQHNGKGGTPDKCSQKFANEPNQKFHQALTDFDQWLMKFCEFSKGEITRTMPLLSINQLKIRRDDELAASVQVFGLINLRKNNRRAKVSSGWIKEDEEDPDFGICISNVCDLAIKFLEGARLPLPEQMELEEAGKGEPEPAPL